MSTSISLHTSTQKNFEVKAYIAGSGSNIYPVVTVGDKYESTVTIFPSFDQVREMHAKLTKLIGEMYDITEQVSIDEVFGDD